MRVWWLTSIALKCEHEATRVDRWRRYIARVTAVSASQPLGPFVLRPSSSFPLPPSPTLLHLCLAALTKPRHKPQSWCPQQLLLVLLLLLLLRRRRRLLQLLLPPSAS